MIQRIKQAIKRLCCGKQKQQNLVTEEVLKLYNEKILSKMNIEDYNGGITVMDFGLWKSPLPIPDKGMKWVVRWHDTKSGELLPELTQAPISEPNSDWFEGYPKYQ